MKNLSSTQKAIWATALISITWGTTWLPSKLLVGDYKVPPMQISALRFFIAGLSYSLFFYFKTKKLPTLFQLKKIAFLSIFFIVGANFFSLKALSYHTIGSGIGAVLGATLPLWVAAISIFIFKKQKFTAQILGGLLLGFGGIIIIFYKELQVITKPEYSLPILYSTLASISWGAGTLLNAKKDRTLNVFYSLGLQMLMGSIILYALSFAIEDRISLQSITANGWLCFAYLVIIGSFISFASYMYALKHLPATQVALYAYINPIVALLLGYSLHNEPLSWYILVGTLLTLVGVYLVNNGFAKQVFEEE